MACLNKLKLWPAKTFSLTHTLDVHSLTNKQTRKKEEKERERGEGKGERTSGCWVVGCRCGRVDHSWCDNPGSGLGMDDPRQDSWPRSSGWQKKIFLICLLTPVYPSRRLWLTVTHCPLLARDTAAQTKGHDACQGDGMSQPSCLCVTPNTVTYVSSSYLTVSMVTSVFSVT